MKGDRYVRTHLPQLPARPSLEQLRKQAKDLLRACQDGVAAAAERIRRHRPEATDPSLADAQFALAREYGFESWPELVHHVDAANSADLDHFNDIARDLVVAYAGDAEALVRLNDRFSSPKDLEQFRQMVQQRREQIGGERTPPSSSRLPTLGSSSPEPRASRVGRA